MTDTKHALIGQYMFELMDSIDNDLAGNEPLREAWNVVCARRGDKVTMTMHGIGDKEVYVIRIIRAWNKQNDR